MFYLLTNSLYSSQESIKDFTSICKKIKYWTKPYLNWAVRSIICNKTHRIQLLDIMNKPMMLILWKYRSIITSQLSLS